jgi:hypothetical protein
MSRSRKPKVYNDPSCKHHGGCSWCADGRTHSSRRRAPVEDWGSMDDLLAASLKFLDEYKPGDPLKVVW